ncbi:cell wall hydrolase [Brevundimonas sp.]|uniref:cell wall hydrolase n=1 Tax=Brevundimonas sp. TaxID=1871086 RepID=UPI00286BCF9C|nr:cell wall hydrolase [Brevundimonas sp.]
MLRSGEGARLTEPAPQSRRATPGRRRALRSSTPAAPTTPPPAVVAAAATSTVIAPASTIQPPAYVGGAAPRSSGAYYTPPRLDLTTPPRVPTSDVECLTQAIYYEARNESEEGQAAVAEVVMNRSRSGAYPRSVCAVVYQRNSRTCQFTFTCDGAIGRSPVDMVKWARAERIARDVHEGRMPAALPATSLNYHASYVSPSWGRRLERVRQIGTHIFYGAALGGGGTPGALTPPAEPPARTGGLVFVRNEALDRAYAALQGAAAAPSGQP